LFGLLEQVGPKYFLIALNNVSSHGEVFEKNFNEFLDDEDKFLGKWFDGIEGMLKAVKEA
jgi:hypothetical protein